MKRILIIVGLALALVIPASAQTAPVKGEWFVDWQGYPYVAVSTQVGLVERPLGLDFNLEARTWLGFRLKDSVPGMGFALTYTRPLAANVEGWIGPAILANQGEKVRGGVLLGVSVRF